MLGQAVAHLAGGVDMVCGTDHIIDLFGHCVQGEHVASVHEELHIQAI